MKVPMSRVAFAATIGTVIEWYDFFIYITAAALVFNKLFFPQASPLMGTLLAFGASATGFLARPLGAVVAGHYGDRIGRKALLMVTLLTMGFATFAIGLLPTYQSIGVAAPLLLLALRIVQGFATGGEWGGAALMTVEYAQNRRRGFWGSLITVGILLGLVLASFAFSTFSKAMSDQAFLAWGWRVPFLLSALLVLLGFYIRSRVGETPEFQRMKERGEQASQPIVAAFAHFKGIAVIFFIRIAENFSFYTFAAFSLAYVTGTLHLPRTIVLNAVIVAALAECVTSVLFGMLADRIGSRRVLRFGLAFQVLFAYPFFLLLETKALGAIMLAVVLGFALGNGPISAVEPDYFAKFFGVNIRYSGISLGRESATIIGAGLAPVIATALVSLGLGSWPVAACMAGTSIIGLIAMLMARKVENVAAEPETVIPAAKPAGVGVRS